MTQKFINMGLKSSTADLDVWMRPAVKLNGEEYYEYILVYVDNIIAVSIKANEVMDEISTTFKFKNGKVSEFEVYLGAKLQKKSINGKICWTMSSMDYINAATKIIEGTIKNTIWKLPTKLTTPIVPNSVPELNGTPELDADETQHYQELICLSRWSTEIGRVDILHEVSILSQYVASPREGHMEQLFYICWL